MHSTLSCVKRDQRIEVVLNRYPSYTCSYNYFTKQLKDALAPAERYCIAVQPNYATRFGNSKTNLLEALIRKGAEPTDHRGEKKVLTSPR